MSKPTPGPWGVIGNPYDRELAIGPTLDIRVAYVPDTIDLTPKEHAANARLIAAAPDMLEALRCMTKYVEEQVANPKHTVSNLSCTPRGGPSRHRESLRHSRGRQN